VESANSQGSMYKGNVLNAYGVSHHTVRQEFLMECWSLKISDLSNCLRGVAKRSSFKRDLSKKQRIKREVALR